MDLNVEDNLVSWTYNGNQVVIDESCIVKGAIFVPNEGLVLVLLAERGQAQHLLAFNKDGSLKFSLLPPKKFFYYFSELPDGFAVSSGDELSAISTYKINFELERLES